MFNGMLASATEGSCLVSYTYGHKGWTLYRKDHWQNEANVQNVLLQKVLRYQWLWQMIGSLWLPICAYWFMVMMDL